jgi:uncharacterized LabA/DUF88 family protein
MSTYIFIDGGYLRRRHAENTEKWFGRKAEIDFPSVVSQLARPNRSYLWMPVERASQIEQPIIKSFYYDCLDEEQRPAESDLDFGLRINEQNALINNIRQIDGCHIRLGALKGIRRKKRQKEVDILLAVDMMTHAARQNMTKAVLLAGDQDFKPAVESLVQLGIYVHIVGDSKTTSRELTWAASAYTELHFEDFYGWTSGSSQPQFQRPNSGNNTPAFQGQKLIKEGTTKGERCTLFEFENGFIIYFESLNGQKIYYMHKELERLQLYLEIIHGPIIWD